MMYDFHLIQMTYLITDQSDRIDLILLMKNVLHRVNR